MKMRQRRKQFWWIYRAVKEDHPMAFGFLWVTTYSKWGLARIVHQIKEAK